MHALELQPRSPNVWLGGSSSAVVGQRAREREGRALLDAHRQKMLELEWKEAEETKEEEAGVGTPSGTTEDVGLRFYGAGWDDMAESVGRGGGKAGGVGRDDLQRGVGGMEGDYVSGAGAGAGPGVGPETTGAELLERPSIRLAGDGSGFGGKGRGRKRSERLEKEVREPLLTSALLAWHMAC